MTTKIPEPTAFANQKKPDVVCPCLLDRDRPDADIMDLFFVAGDAISMIVWSATGHYPERDEIRVGTPGELRRELLSIRHQASATLSYLDAAERNDTVRLWHERGVFK